MKKLIALESVFGTNEEMNHLEADIEKLKKNKQHEWTFSPGGEEWLINTWRACVNEAVFGVKKGS